jgi:uncharacterized protein
MAPLTRSQAYEASGDIGRSPEAHPTIGDVIAARYHRRDILRGTLGTVVIAALTNPMARAFASHDDNATRFNFPEVGAGVDQRHHVPEGYDADVLIRWGDPVLPGAPPFDPLRQNADAQRLQFGYNNDFVGYIPIPGAADPARHGLLVINHDTPTRSSCFPGLGGRTCPGPDSRR